MSEAFWEYFTMNKALFHTPSTGISPSSPRGPKLDLQPVDPTPVRDLPIAPISLSKSSEAPAREDMLLTNEAGLACAAPPWSLVEQVLRELHHGRGNGFCVLERPNNNYVQCLRGFNGWHLEWRLGGSSLDSYIHLRAGYRDGSRKAFELKKSDFVNPGQHRDLLQLPDVLDAFRAFHRGDGPTKSLEWRELEI